MPPSSIRIYDVINESGHRLQIQERETLKTVHRDLSTRCVQVRVPSGYREFSVFARTAPSEAEFIEKTQFHVTPVYSASDTAVDMNLLVEFLVRDLLTEKVERYVLATT